MFGIEHKITDGSLYLLSDMIDGLSLSAIEELKRLPDSETIKKLELKAKIEWYKVETEKFQKDINDQLKEKFQFSSEDLYAMYGQYDKYISIEFHKFSESAKKFGRNISGIIKYLKSEREQFDSLLTQNTTQRTDGLIKIDCDQEKDLTIQQKIELKELGFRSSDVYQILTTNLPKVKSYDQPGRKEIPNTITVNFDSTDFDPNSAFFWLYGQKVKHGEQLIDDEWARFCALSIFFDPESQNVDIIKEHSLNPDGSLKSIVRLYELEAKFNSKIIKPEELSEFNDLLKSRREQRIEAIKYEIKRSTNKKLEVFETEYPEIYKELMKSTVQFQDESLVYFHMEKPIYWDYEGFLHIYLRHCDELAIEGHHETKTKFQYTQEDIKRILKIAIDRLTPQINERLKEGKDFRLYGDKSLYFNGNHYALHILETGRVAAFHPLENPTKK
ncbi:hypothetical protein QWT87_20345 [Chryseobacterium sp. APV1]|uniref:DUF4263 domain-containing protein n=1 Tax=Chryseobacterium urinae TaxID=3058400 RepID=A0ABT8UAT7_9FLAO|nr:hypothetical protein [Chryseobacterium sp. APV1]MDO3427235.1 hypothetical protein [Chryseobacterium sp. APV1]